MLSASKDIGLPVMPGSGPSRLGGRPTSNGSTSFGGAFGMLGDTSTKAVVHGLGRTLNPVDLVWSEPQLESLVVCRGEARRYTRQ